MSEIHLSYAPEIQKQIDYPFDTENLPTEEIAEGRYVARFAHTAEEIDAALRLRFEVFNLELHEGLESSYITERDEDEFDQTCHHLIVVEKQTNNVVGTYRLRTVEMARRANGFYTETEFDLSLLSEDVLTKSVEIGRACIDRNHRNSRVLFLLWKGLALYMTFKQKRFMFGCCSLMSQDCTEGARVLRQLKRDGHVHETLKVLPRADCACLPTDFLTADSDAELELPRLFGTYLRIGAKVCGEPTIDRQFKTIDFFVIFDKEAVPEKYFDMLFAGAEALLSQQLNSQQLTVSS